MKPTRLLLFSILALAAFVRFYHLGQESVWFDEGWTVRVAGLPPAAIVADAAADVHPPLYYFFMKVWTALAGSGEWTIRLPSVLFGLAAVWALYGLGRAMFGGAAGLAAAFLLALSVFHVRYCQEARSYSLLAMLALFSTWAFWNFLTSNLKFEISNFKSWMPALLYLLPSVPLLYVHNFGLLLIAGQWAYLAGLWIFARPARDARLLRAWLAVQGILGLCYLPWIGVLLRQVSMIRQGFWIPPLTLKTVSYAFVEYGGTRKLMWLFLIFAGLALLLRRRGNAECGMRNAELCLGVPPSGGISSIPHSLHPQFFLALAILIPNAVPYVVSKLMAPMYTTKSTIYCAPLLYLLAASAIVRLPWRALRAGVLFLLGALALAACLGEDARTRKEPWRVAVSEIERQARKDDLLLFNWGQCFDNAYYYYRKRYDVVVKPFPDTAGWNWTIDEKAMAKLDPLLQGRDRVWVVFCRGRDTRGLLIGRLRELYGEAFHKFYPGYDEYIEVYRFEKP